MSRYLTPREKTDIKSYGNYTTIALEINKNLYDMYIKAGFLMGRHTSKGQPYVEKGEGAKLQQSTSYVQGSTWYAVPTDNLVVIDVDCMDDFKRFCDDFDLFPPPPNGYTSTGNPRYYCSKPRGLNIPMHNDNFPQLEFLTGRNKYVHCLGQFMRSKVEGNKVKEGATGIYTFNHLDLWNIDEVLVELSKKVTLLPKHNLPTDPLSLALQKSEDSKYSEDEILTALKFVSSDVPNDEWIKTIYAIGRSGLSDERALEIAINWSESGGSFDSMETPRRIQALFNESRVGGGITVNSLIYNARKGKTKKIVELLNSEKVTMREVTPVLTQFPVLQQEDKDYLNTHLNEGIGGIVEVFEGDVSLVEVKKDIFLSSSMLSDDDQIEIINDIFSKYFLINDKLKYVTKDIGIVSIQNVGVFTGKIISEYQHYENFVTFDEEKETKTKPKPIYGININRVYIQLVTERPYEVVSSKNDLFAEQPHCILDFDTREVTKVNNKLLITKPSFMGNTTQHKTAMECYGEIIKDYKDHFPQLDNILRFFMACRFTEDREHSHLYLRMPSRWGKSAFKDILIETLKVAIEVSYADIFENQKSTISPSEFQRSFVMIVDEFTKFPANLKEWDSRRSFASKNQLREKVEIFGKMYMSANKSSSFNGSVTPQIANRVINMDMGENSVMMVERPVYQRFKAHYTYCTTLYIYNTFIALKEEYLSMGKYTANLEASKFLSLLHGKFKIKTGETIGTFIKDELLPLLQKHIKRSVNEMGFEDDNIQKIIKGKYTGSYFVKGYSRILQDLAKVNFDEDQIKSINHNRAEFPELMGCPMVDKLRGGNFDKGEDMKRGIIVTL